MTNRALHQILIVDDSPPARELYRRYLTRDNEATYEILEATSVKSALALCDRHRPDLILLDYWLPDENGLVFLEEWRVRYGDVPAPVVMLTGRGNEQVAVDAMKQGAQDYLIKGVLTPEQLCRSVHSVIERLSLLEQLEQKRKHQQLVSAIALRIWQSLNSDTVLQTAVQEVLELLQTDRVLIYRVWPDGTGTVVTETVMPDYPAILHQSFPAEVFPPTQHQFYCRGNSRTINDVNHDELSPCLIDFVKSFGVQAKLVVPILQNDQGTDVLWGLLIVHHCRAPRQWQAWEVEVLKQLAVQLAIAIQQTELYHHLQSLNASLEQQVTERTEALVASERRFRGIFDNSFQFTGLLTPDGTLLEANQTALEFGGIKREDIIHRPFWEAAWWRFSPAIQTQLQDAIARAAQGEFVRYEVDVVGKDQQVTTIDFSLRPFWNDTGDVILLIPEGRDVSDRKQAETTLKVQAQILNQIHDAVVATDLDGTIQTWNLGAERLYGYTAEEAIGQNVRMLYGPEELPLLQTIILQPLFDLGFHEVEMQNYTKSGTQIYISLRLSVVRDEAGQPIRLIGCSNSISDRKQAELALQASEAQYRRIVETAHEGIWIINAEHQTSFVNPKMLEMLGYSETEMLGKSLFDFMDETGIALALANVERRRQGIAENHDFKFRHKNGTDIWTLIATSPIVDESGQYVGSLGMLTDITDRKRAELALQELNQSLELKVEERTAELRASETQIRAMIEAIPDLLLRFSLDSRCDSIYALNQPEAFFPIPQHSSEVLPPELVVRQLEQVKQAIATRELQVYEHHFYRGSRLVYEEVRIAAINDHEALLIVRDVTERQQAELALKESQRFIQQVADASPNILYLYDVQEQRNIYINREITSVLGYHPSEMQATGTELFRQLIHPEDLQLYSDHVAQLHQSPDHTILDVEYRLRHASGEWRWFFSREAVFRRTATGQVQQTIGTAQDLSDRKQIEEQLRHSEIQLRNLSERLTLALQSGGFGSWEYDFVSSRQFWDDRMYKLYGICPEEFTGTLEGWLECVHPADRSRLLELQSEYDTEFRIIHPTGEIRYLKAYGIVQYNDQQEPIRMIGINYDITDLKVAEMALRNSESRFATLATAAPVAIFRLDPDSQCVYVNERWSDMTGRPKEFAMGMGWVETLHPEDRERIQSTWVQWVNTGGDFFQAEGRHLRPDGQITWFYGQLVPETTAQGTVIGYIGTLTDITKRKQVEDERQQAEAELRRVNDRLTLTNADLYRATRLKDEFLANMSHELRTPLNAILGMSEVLQDGVLGPLSDRQKGAVTSIERSGQHLLALINDILDLAKVESGKLELQLAPVEINYLCTSSLNFVRQQAIAKNIQLSTELPFGLPEIVVDELRIRQVLINLLSNAVKFTPNGGQVRLVVREERSTDQRYLSFQIFDTGIGIAAQDLDTLFQPFTQIDSRLNRRHAGTGLGLSVVRRLVELHQGTVAVTSEVNQGSCFSFYLPYRIPEYPTLTTAQRRHYPPQGGGCATVAGSPTDQNQSSTSPPVHSHGNALILLVEDNEMNAITISNYLEARGYRLVFARNGKEAIVQATTHRPDLILMDIQMPEMDGLEAIARIRENPDLGEIPIIAVTALAMEGDRDKCLATGANDYMTKPIKLKQLVHMIQGWLPFR